MSKVVLSLAVILSLTVIGIAGEPLKIWHYESCKDIQYSVSKGNIVAMNSSEIRTPNGQKTLAFTLQQLNPDAVPWDIQLNFIYDKSLRAGHNYELSFYCKGSVPGNVSMLASLAVPPWTPLPGAVSSLIVTKDWQLIKFPFTAQKDWPEKLHMPRFMLAKYGEPATISFGPVTLREVPLMLPLSLNPEWSLFLKHPEINHFTSMPEDANPRKVMLTNDLLDIAQIAGIFKPRDCAVLFNRFESSQEGVMRIGFSADWWLELYINGEKIYDTMANGNVSHAFVPNDHVVDLPIRAGNNLLAVKVFSGAEGWRFVCGKATRPPVDLLSINAGTEWKPIDMSKLRVKAGTALDFSAMVAARHPAGELGRMTINSAGRLAFEKEPQKPVRLFGFNCSLGGLKFWSKEQIKAAVEGIARQGYNTVRFQQVDIALTGAWWPKRKMKNPGDGEIPFDPESFDKFDYLLSCLKANGIYFNLDLMTYGYCGFTSSQNFSTRLYFDPVYRNHWETAVKTLLNRHNPYTGIRLKDETALICLEPLNEQDFPLYNKAKTATVTPLFREYLKKKYRTEDALRRAWNQMNISFATIPNINEQMFCNGNAQAKDAGQFLIEIMSELTLWYHERLRSYGYPGLISQWDMIMRNLELPVRAMMPVIAQHSYAMFPTPIPTKNMVVKSKNNDHANSVCGGSAKGSDILMQQDSSLNSSYFQAAAAIRFLDRPFMITEYSHTFFNRYRHERGLYFGSYAALQGWDALKCHTDEMFMTSPLRPLIFFESAHDPISRASEAVIVLTWFRSDVREAMHTVQLDLSGKVLFPKHYQAAIGADYAKLAMLTKIGIAYPEVKPLDTVGKIKPDMELPVTEFSPLGVTQWYATASSKDGKIFPELLQKIKDSRLLPPSNRTDYAKRLFQSETGEIVLNGRTETMTVITPRLEGAIIKKDVPVKLARMEIASCSKPASVVVASLDKNQSLDHAKRLLLIFSTNALNSGMTFENSSMSLMVEVGSLPVLMETAKLTLKLKSAQNTAPTVYALNMDGTRAESVPVSFNDSCLSLALDTNTLKYATPFFEIIFP